MLNKKPIQISPFHLRLCLSLSLSISLLFFEFFRIRIDNQGLCATLRIQFCHTTSTDHFTDCNTPNKSALKSTYRFDSCVTSNAKHNSIHIYSSWQRTVADVAAAAAAASLFDWFHEICALRHFHTLNERANTKKSSPTSMEIYFVELYSGHCD